MNRETIEKAIDARLDEPDNQWDGIFNSGYSRGFKEGARWRINEAWHEASEYPNPHTPILVVRDGGLYSVNMVANVKQRELPTSWKRWAYITDLLPDARKEAEP